MKVLLLEPFVPEEAKWGSFKTAKGFILPMGMIAIYSYLKSKGVNVKFIDTQFAEYSKDDIRKLILEDNELKIIGIPVFTNSAYYSFNTTKFCKQVRPDLTIVLGGVHVTVLPERTLQECPWADYIVIGEGEITFYELVSRLAGGKTPTDIAGIGYRANREIKINSPRPYIQNLDELPLTCYEDIDLSRYVPHPTQYKILPNFPFLTQRGCPYQCTFCEAAIVHGKKIRHYSVERVINELEILVREFGARGIYFQDSTFTINRNYTLQLMEKMIEANLNLQWACNTRCDRVDAELLQLMKRAGCWMINYGLESANQESLDILKKGFQVEQIIKSIEMTKKIGIAAVGNFILAIPGENQEMVENTIKFAKKLLPDIALFYLPVPYPGSELYQICRKTGGLREDALWEDYLAVDFDHPVYINPLLGEKKMKYYYRKAYREFYSNPRYLIKMLFKIRSYDDIKRYWRGLSGFLGSLSYS